MRRYYKGKDRTETRHRDSSSDYFRSTQHIAPWIRQQRRREKVEDQRRLAGQRSKRIYNYMGMMGTSC